MTILDRLVAKSFLRLFLATTLGVPVLFIVGNLIERVDDFLDRGIGVADVALAYVYTYPKFMLWAFPIAALVATTFTIHSMTTHREIVAAKAGGISFYRLVTPLVVLGVILAGFAYALSDVVPVTNRMAAEKMGDREVRRGWRSYFVFQGEDGRSVSVQRLSVEEGKLFGVAMEKEGEGTGEPSVHVLAKEAVWDSVSGWTFLEGHMRYLYPEGPERVFRFSRLEPRGFTERPVELLEDPRDDEQMTYAEIERLAGIMRRSGGDPTELLVKKEQRLALAITTLVIILFGAPLSTSSKRGGTAYGIGISLGSTILYIALFKLSGAAGASGAMSPLAAAWIPNALFFAAGVVLLARVRT